MYLVRISVVHQLKSVTIILCLLGFLCTLWWFYGPVSISLPTSASLWRLLLIIYKPDEAGPSFTLAEYGIEFVVVQSPSWLDANWSLGLISRNSTARYLTNEHEGQRINSLSDTLQPPVFDIYASRTFLGYPSSENGAIEGWDIIFLDYHSYHEMWKPDIKAPECT